MELWQSKYGAPEPKSGLSGLRKRYMKLFAGAKTKRTLPEPDDKDFYVKGACNNNPGGELNWGFANNPAITNHGTWSGAGTFFMKGLEGCTGG